MRRALALALALLAASDAGAADGALPIATSPRAAGRGGTSIAVADDAYTVTSNPAGMTNLIGTRIDLTLAFYTAQSTYTNAYNHSRVGSGVPTPAPALAFVQALGPPGADDARPYAFGVVLEPVSGGGGDALFRTPAFPGGERETSSLAVLGASFGFALRVQPRLTLGLAVTGLYVSLDQKGLAGGGGGGGGQPVRNYTGGQLDLADPLFLVNGQPATWGQVLGAGGGGSSSSAVVELDGVTGYGGGAVLGALLQVTDTLSIGAAYRTPGLLTDLEGRATVDASAGAGDGLQASFLGGHTPGGGPLVSRFRARLSGLSLPQTAGVGAAWWPRAGVLLALDVKWIGWSTAFDTIEVDLRGGTGRDLSEITSTRLRSKVLLRWHDQVVVSVGGAVAVNDWLRLRAGYHWGQNPVPGGTEGPFSPATVEHHATVGVGFALGRVSLDVAWVHAFAKSTTIRRSAANPDYDGTRHKADQDAFLFGGGIDF